VTFNKTRISSKRFHSSSFKTNIKNIPETTKLTNFVKNLSVPTENTDLILWGLT
jgi:hypothetical protein